jgi:TolB-like protein
MTPEGLKRESDIDRSTSITPETGRKLDRVIIVFLAVAVIALLAERFVPGQDAENTMNVAVPQETGAPMPSTMVTAEPTIDPNSIAVLPFVNMSADPDNEYFSDGIAEEILNVLARVPDLKVAARTSAFAFKGSNQNIPSIANELKVRHVLEGSVRKAGNQVRVTAQLIKADDGYHLWSDTFDRELVNIFAIQDEIATAIADALKVTLDLETGTAGNLTGTNNTDAYDAYLRGMNQWHLRTASSLKNSVDLFEQAIALDPQFARAHAGLALVYAVIMDYTDFPAETGRERARVAAETALAIDSASIEAATAMIFTTNDLEQQLTHARAALQINDGFATTHQWYATALGLVGDLKAAEQSYLRAKELDPRSRVITANVAHQYLIMNRPEEAHATLLDLFSWAPDVVWALDMMFVVKVKLGDLKGAEAIGREILRLMDREDDLLQAYLDLFGDDAARNRARDVLMNQPQLPFDDPANLRVLSDYSLLTLLAYAGEHASARVLLQHHIETAPVYRFGYYRVDQSMPEFICDPETQALFEPLDLPDLRVPYPCEELLQ